MALSRSSPAARKGSDERSPVALAGAGAAVNDVSDVASAAAVVAEIIAADGRALAVQGECRKGCARNRAVHDQCDVVAGLFRASIALTLLLNAFTSRLLPTLPTTIPRNRPLRFFPSRTTM
jgi:hypothetical protein